MGQSRRRSGGGSSSASEPKVPDALGKQARAQLVANTLGDLQSQETQLLIQQTANGSDDSDPVPGLQKANGKPISFAERREVLQKGQRRVAERFRDVMPEVERAIEAAREAAEAAEKAREEADREEAEEKAASNGGSRSSG